MLVEDVLEKTVLGFCRERLPEGAGNEPVYIEVSFNEVVDAVGRGDGIASRNDDLVLAARDRESLGPQIFIREVVYADSRGRADEYGGVPICRRSVGESCLLKSGLFNVSDKVVGGPPHRRGRVGGNTDGDVFDRRSDRKKSGHGDSEDREASHLASLCTGRRSQIASYVRRYGMLCPADPQ